MIPVVMNVGAIAGANAAKRSATFEPPVYIRWEHERVPNNVGGMIFIRNNRNVSVTQNLIEDGVDIRFRGSEEVSRLIDDLTRLRDDMIKKESEYASI